MPDDVTETLRVTEQYFRWIKIRCTRCDHHNHYVLLELIERFGEDALFTDVVKLLEAECPRGEPHCGRHLAFE